MYNKELLQCIALIKHGMLGFYVIPGSICLRGLVCNRNNIFYASIYVNLNVYFNV